MCEPIVDLPEDASPEAVPLATARGFARAAWQNEGHSLEQLAVFAATSGSEFDALEVAALFRISVRAAQHRLDLAVTLSTRLPRTLAAVKAGRLDPYRASKIADATLPLSLEAAAVVEGEILDRVEEMPAVKLCRALRRIVARVNADALRALHEQRVAQRRVDMYPTEDGCSVLTVHGPAARIQVAAKRVDAIAHQLRDTGGADGRTMDQLRSDVALDLLAGKDFEHAKIIVQVTLPARAALGVDNTPGHLVGYGDIAAQQAVDLAYQADATWRRILTEPATGRVLDVGRRRYSPPAALRDHIQAAMPTCTGPGCVRPAAQCDLDHREPFPAGPTDEHNVHPACRSHHRGKTFGGWKIIKRGGILEWVSPCGFHYPHHPEPLTHPEPPPPPF
ncbi:MAG: DUF222 domain-containing protein [Actinophytocola sp.]|uniref:HNH endonuclease signature motif containing protein n=1 Tax=Actinophytocola sp. TaxID=1872138 RepID=UPI0013249162|nr:HNH endonuclease signature motif containing protein [Actinophytocola sp.]MPZ79227.1 DUF222 domain-containing protein [Actinophytocola sp.]